MRNRPEILDIAGIIGFRNAASPAMHNEVTIARFSNSTREICHDRKRQILV
jgi:hypothetical protein